ncbi:hypothetical protein VTN49DRAFT_1431 [Thermomyces lanuginosus]|uniref:uncharacterized protein n=1 Tax=Thermomyces lanuginosus TaxID=5541 RepID=UPI003743ACED
MSSNNSNSREDRLRAKISSLQEQISSLETQLEETKAQLKSPETMHQTVQTHIRLLHRYNEIRDVGQGLLGLLAEARGVRMADVSKEFGVNPED